jgi:flagellar biosynthesis protein FlhB
MTDEAQDKSEQASQHKLREAKNRGSVSKSIDVNSFVMMTVLALGLALWGKAMIEGQLKLGQYILSNVGTMTFAPKQFTHWVVQQFYHALLVCMPLLLVLMVAGVATNLMQTGPIFTTFPLKPDLQRINFAEGFKRVFSIRTLFEGLKSLLKMVALAVAVYFVVRNALPTLFGLGQSDVQRYPAVVLHEIIILLKWCFVALLPLALIDWIFVRRDFAKKMMMSRREVTEEHKQREGDPRIRGKIRELQQEARKRSKSLRSVKDADVLITNPTRLAIALRYNRDEMDAPLVLAKGAGQLAKLMREMAFRHQIPVVENKKMAQGLFRRAAIESQIPQEFYPAAARLLMWVYAQRDTRQAKKLDRA